MKGIWKVGIAVAVASLLAAGCSGGSGVNTAKVNGTVKVAGTPTPGITVTFAPDTGGRPSSGVTDSSGNYTLSTYGDGDGAVPGKYKVAFSVESAAASNLPGEITASTSTTPFNAKYTSGDTSGIAEEVVAGKTNTFSWDLEK